MLDDPFPPIFVPITTACINRVVDCTFVKSCEGWISSQGDHTTGSWGQGAKLPRQDQNQLQSNKVGLYITLCYVLFYQQNLISTAMPSLTLPCFRKAAEEGEPDIVLESETEAEFAVDEKEFHIPGVYDIYIHHI